MMIKEAFDRGFLVSPDAVGVLESNPSAFDLVPQGTLVITRKMLVRREPNFTVDFQHTHSQNERKIENLVDFYSNRLSFLRPEIEKKSNQKNLVSVKNVGSTGDSVTIIGMVRELIDGGFVIDDGTGSIEVLSDKKVLEDIVLGAEGKMSNGRLSASNLIFPDIPASKMKTSKGRILISRGMIPKDSLEGVTHIILDSPSGPVPSEPDVIISRGSVKQDNAFQISMPSRIDINGIKILVFESSLTQEAAITALRSRHLNPTQFFDGDPLLLKDVPDIAVCMSDSPIFANYKGVTLVSPAGASYTIDLETREVKEIKY